jgi:hypothetical protein
MRQHDGRVIATEQHREVDGTRYGRVPDCQEKCWWVEGEAVLMCPLYSIRQEGERVIERCADACET